MGAGAAGDSRGFFGASGRPLPKSWGACGCSHSRTGSSRKDPPFWPAGATLPPQLSSRPPGSCANPPSGHRVLQRGPRDPECGPRRGAGGASRTAACGVRRPWRRGGCSGRSPSLGTPLPEKPRKHPLEKDFPRDFLARGRAECREAKTLPGRRDCPGQGRCRPPDRPTAPTAWQW